MRIDIHTHAFSPNVAEKFLQSLKSTYGIDCQGDGTLEGIERAELAAGIDCYVVLNAAITSAQVVPANDFAIQIQNNPLSHAVAFGTVRPDYQDWEAELDRLEKHGVRGLKFHPSLQGFKLDDASLLPIYEACSKRFIVLFHGGSLEQDLSKANSTPYMARRLAEMFPEVDFVAAHFGSCHMWHLAIDAFKDYKGEHLWFDTSSSARFLPPSQFRELFSILPPERYLFGTDWPIVTPCHELAGLAKAGLSATHIESILGNAQALLQAYHAIP